MWLINNRKKKEKGKKLLKNSNDIEDVKNDFEESLTADEGGTGGGGAGSGCWWV